LRTRVIAATTIKQGGSRGVPVFGRYKTLTAGKDELKTAMAGMARWIGDEEKGKFQSDTVENRGTVVGRVARGETQVNWNKRNSEVTRSHGRLNGMGNDMRIADR